MSCLVRVWEVVEAGAVEEGATAKFAIRGSEDKGTAEGAEGRGFGIVGYDFAAEGELNGFGALQSEGELDVDRP